MPRAWSAKRERQYEHIKDGLEDRGRPEGVAEEIAARTVNKERARAGEVEDGKSQSRPMTFRLDGGVGCGRTPALRVARRPSSTAKHGA